MTARDAPEASGQIRARLALFVVLRIYNLETVLKPILNRKAESFDSAFLII
jgi:hypothetical protein